MEKLQSATIERIAKRFPNFDKTPTFRALPPGLKLELIQHSKAILSGRLSHIRDIAFDQTQTSFGNASTSSAYQTTYKNRIINIQSYFNTWEEGDVNCSSKSSESESDNDDQSDEDQAGEDPPAISLLHAGQPPTPNEGLDADP